MVSERIGKPKTSRLLHIYTVDKLGMARSPRTLSANGRCRLDHSRHSPSPSPYPWPHISGFHFACLSSIYNYRRSIKLEPTPRLQPKFYDVPRPSQADRDWRTYWNGLLRRGALDKSAPDYARPAQKLYRA